MSALPAQLQAAVTHRYRIEDELGRGGMAIVFRAWDLKHHRHVALKLLRPELAGAIGAERFLREIRVAARLTHPNILPLHDSDEVAGFLFYVMPLVEGESLRQRIQREGPLPMDEALRIVREVAEALTHAHAAGVVHRDVKPENIMFQAGHAVLSDFGIAHAIDVSAQEALTATGIAIGTPMYMSPEQASGNVDARSDIYSLACVAYELFAGQPPFTGSTNAIVLARHALDAVPSLGTLRPGIPRGVEQAITRALAKTAADRFASASDFVTALASAADAGAPPRSIAVLPFVNLGGDPDNEWFADGITEDVIAQLSRIRALKVIARTSVMAFKTREISVRDIARRLDVATVLEGSVRRAGDRVRIVAQLIDAGTERQLWAETHDRQMTDIFAIQSDVAVRIAEALHAELLPKERQRLREHSGAASRAPSPRAYEAYLRGRFHLHQHTPEGLSLALRCFDQALEIDPDYTLALGAIADVWGARTHVGLVAPRDSRPIVSERVARALELDDGVPETHDWAGRVRFWFEWDWAAAEREYLRAIELNSNYPDARMMYSVLLNVSLRWDEARAQAARAIELDPLNPLFQWAHALQPLFRGQYDDALQQFQTILRLEPGFPLARLGLWSVVHEQQRYDEALAQATRYFETLGDVEVLASLGDGRATGGYADAMRRVGETLARRFVTRYVPPSLIARAFVYAGDREQAFRWITTAHVERDFDMVFVALHPAWGTLRGDQRFGDLVRRMRFRAPGDQAPNLPRGSATRASLA